MSKYTTEVRYICEENCGFIESQGYANVREVIERSRKKIFDFDYPIFDQEYKSIIETKILKHFYTREIACETVGLWKLWLDARMNEVMPYYNKLYESALLEFNPLHDVDLTTTRNKNNEGNKTDNETKGSSSETNRELTGSEAITRNTEGEITKTDNGSGNSSVENGGTSNSNSWDYYTDTPQGGINGIESHNYLTNARNITNEETHSDTTDTDYETTANSTANNTETQTTENTKTNNETSSSTYNETGDTTSAYTSTEEYIEHVVGKTGGISYSKMLNEYRNTILNIDMQVIHSLDDLFFNLW